jgi:predicted O-methyltransferase YrrM
MFEGKVKTVIDKVDALRHKVDDHWQVPRVEAEVLAQIVRLGHCVSLCEIGTSYGFSTLHLAAATREAGGHVDAFDLDPKKIAAAGAHLAEAGLSATVTLHQGDARQTVRAFHPAKPYDFAFIDATKDQSDGYLDALLPHLAKVAILVTDNTATHAQELAGFVARLRALPGATGCQVPVGNGFDLTVVRRA